MSVTTFPITTGSDDAELTAVDSATYPNSAFSARASTGAFPLLVHGLSGTYRWAIMTMRFDTSAIPDTDDITAASIQVVPSLSTNTNSKPLVFGWFTWAGTNADLAYPGDASLDNAHSGTAWGSLTNETVQSFTLSNLSNINTSGYTGIRASLGGGQPTGQNLLWLYAYEDATKQEPRLVVTHTAASVTSEEMVGVVGI